MGSWYICCGGGGGGGRGVNETIYLSHGNRVNEHKCKCNTGAYYDLQLYSNNLIGVLSLQLKLATPVKRIGCTRS